MIRAYLTFSIHCHQPVGNFEWIFEGALDRCYKPFLDRLARHPSIKASLHFSGPLIDWVEKHRPDFIDDLAALVDRGQVEMLGGGYYEPILAVLPVEDALGQIEMMAAWTQARFGRRPRGLWLTERIWEPSLPDLLSSAGVEFTLTDDNHFRYAGLSDDQLAGYYLTENRGNRLAVFPIDRRLRYTIPFKQPEETIRHLQNRSQFWPGIMLNYGDDGEKFGLWPETYEWVYEERWLERFFEAIEAASDWLESVTCSEALDRFDRVGRVYLPTASYHEMMEWALPPHASAQLSQLVKELKRRDDYERLSPFLRGGFWNNFFVKYPESNRMHKRMLRASGLVRRAGGSAPEEARRALYRSQCNCAYWHGLFGGLYLNYLRHAVYENLLLAETLADEAAGEARSDVVIEREDYDCCGMDEVLVRTPTLTATIQPSHGAGLSEIAYRPKNFCLTNVMARRPEAYHELVGVERHGEADGSPKSIHEVTKSKEEDLQHLLYYDWHDRLCFLDHVLGDGYDLDSLESVRYREWGDFVNTPYAIESIERAQEGVVEVRLRREGGLWITADRYPFTIEKTYRFRADRPAVDVSVRLANENEERRRVTYGCEVNLTLLAGHDQGRRYEIGGVDGDDAFMDSRGISRGIESLAMVDRAFGFRVVLTSDRRGDLYRWPIQTVSQSEGGFERTYQGSCILWVHELEMAPGASADLNFSLTVEELRG